MAIKKRFKYKMAPPLNEHSVHTGVGRTALDKKTIAKDIPCQSACPVGTNVPAYIEAISQKEYAKAYAINQESNVFPGVLGRVCTRPCEDRCRHLWTNTQGPVSICHLKRSAADLQQTPAEPVAPWFSESGRRVAVIGGGPGGLTAARELKRLGHAVTLFEREQALGGMATFGIPRFRLPNEIVKREVQLIVDSGIDVKTGVTIDQAGVDRLLTAFDIVVIAAGTTVSNTLTLDGADGAPIIDGLAFMHRYNTGAIGEMSGNVLIVGGGFTAVDSARGCARAAKRLVGEAGDVSIMYRRSEQYMSADMEEMEELTNEQINVRTLVTPLRVTTEGGRISAVSFTRNMLSKINGDDKPHIVPVPGSEFTVPCDHLIVAIGQHQDWSLLPDGVDLASDHATTHPKLFVAGDYFLGSKDIIHAIESGRRAAFAIDEALMGERRMETVVEIEAIDGEGETGRTRDHDLQVPAPMPMLSVLERSMGDAEVESGFDPASAAVNATRCYFCHYKFEIDQDKCIHCDWCIEAAPRECIYKVSRVFTDADGAVTDYVAATRASDATYIYIDSDKCIRCGNCLRVCPTEAISMRRVSLERRPCASETRSLG